MAPRVAYPRTSGDSGRGRAEMAQSSVHRTGGLKHLLEHNMFRLAACLLLIGTVVWCALLYIELRTSVLVAPAAPTAVTASGSATSVLAKANFDVPKSDVGVSAYVRIDPPRAPAAGKETPAPDSAAANRGTKRLASAGEYLESAAKLISREWSYFQTVRDTERRRAPAREAKSKPPVKVAALDPAEPIPTVRSVPSPVAGVPSDVDARTTLVDFDTAPFPYRGTVPGTSHPFLNADEDGHRGHVNFRGRVFWESETFSDDRVLLEIPPNFDPRRPAVMVVFFHGHGANLARDVRDRQRVPAQIAAAGMNAVLVAPQFAVNAADSSSGKFWEPNGFKRFLDEAAVKLGNLYGDPASTKAFANMPVVIVAYSGGFGPTLSVLERGGVRSRIRGLVLLDALYGGMEKFAEWIANNRSAFFVSSFTPHTARRNAELESLLNERGVPHGSELRRSRLQGMVAFLPAGDVSHRDFVTHAWTDNPVKDILVRMGDSDPKVESAGITSSIPTTGSAAPRRD